jgi:putative phosphoribosyl transferase
MIHKFKDRREAGELLAKHLKERYAGEKSVVVALPRGGLEVGLPIVEALQVPLKALVVRKLGAPQQPELAIGALASGGFIYLNKQLIESLQVTEEELIDIKDRESRELLRRENLLGTSGSALEVKDTDVLIVDDGIATGATIEVAIRAIKAGRPSSISIAVPVAPLQAIERLHRHVDHIYSLQRPIYMGAIGDFYESFPQVSDEHALQLLAVGNMSERRADAG